MKTVIIGASFAGIHCALRAKQLRPYEEVVIIEKEETLGYIPSGLILLLNQHIKSLDEATFISKDALEKKGIHLILGISATKFNFSEQYIETTKDRVYYDKLVLAMGSSQVSQKLVSNHPSFLTYKKKKDSELALEKIELSKEIAVIGAGQTGMELASALVNKGKEVTLIESMSYPLYKSFDEDVIGPLMSEMSQESKLTTYFSQTVKEIKGDNLESELTIVTQQNTISCEAAFLSTNVRPDLSLFEEQLDYHTDQTLKIDAYFETSQPNVFAIGDLVQVPSMLLNQSMYSPLINNAIRSGQICAENLEEKKVAYQGSIRVIGTYVFGQYLASCGLTEADFFLYEEPIETLILDIPLSTIEKDKKIKIKFTYNKNTRILLGVQMISRENILEKINRYTLAIESKMTIDELAKKDHFYHPLYANPVSDII
ncbi:FAD-dependent oxidoreductase [Vagococcus carniphilus]|uniref:FAD-dependent oxidoreductase n=1 Tax=Vagococcus carniphilus TaxID=218144 RepID=UPI003BABD49B